MKSFALLLSLMLISSSSAAHADWKVCNDKHCTSYGEGEYTISPVAIFKTGVATMQHTQCRLSEVYYTKAGKDPVTNLTRFIEERSLNCNFGEYKVSVVTSCYVDGDHDHQTLFVHTDQFDVSIKLKCGEQDIAMLVLVHPSWIKILLYVLILYLGLKRARINYCGGGGTYCNPCSLPKLWYEVIDRFYSGYGSKKDPSRPLIAPDEASLLYEWAIAFLVFISIFIA